MILAHRSMKSLLLILLALVGACGGGQPEKPALVVFVVLDQVRADMLERYDTLFTGGFRRLHDRGLRFTEAVHDHAHTTTAAGHTTLSTGVFPSRNGIVKNEWLERDDLGWRSVYSFEDSLATILGLPAREGRSPANLLRGGLADWILEADSGALIFTASHKDRAAIPLAGKTRGHTYWLAENEARFVTSSYYASEYPGWVERFNREVAPEIMGRPIWDSTIPAHGLHLSRPDTAEYEGDGYHTYFPHLFEAEVDDDRPGAQHRWVMRKPFPDEALGAFVQEGVGSLGLGADETTDFLALSFSQPDYIGHDYGPLSREQLDNLLRLDKVVGELLAFLDETVGSGRWVMALSADHGVLTCPEYLVEQGFDASRATRQDFAAVRSIFRDLEGAEGDPLELVDEAVAALEALPFVADAMSVAELTSSPAADSFTVFLRNSYRPDRWTQGYGSQGTGIAFRFIEGFRASSDSRGTGHGSPYYYDRHVPLVFYGPGVEAGVSRERARTVDIAPTLAWLAQIPVPGDLDGQPLLQ